MTEYKLHHLVKQLVDEFGVKDDAAKDLLELLQKRISTESNKVESGINVVQQLAQTSTNPDSFTAKVEELQQKNVDCLAEYLRLLNYISQDSALKSFLQEFTSFNRQVSDSVMSLSTSSSRNITKEDVPEVKNRLKQVTSSAKQNINRDCSKLLDRSLVPVSCSSAIVSWVKKRPCMSWDFYSSEHTNLLKHSIQNIPSDSQESVIIDDLLNILIGLPGSYIEALELNNPHGHREFKINDHVEDPIKQLINQILPLASHFSIVQRFIEERVRFEYGQVSNALAESMSKLIIEYTLFITQLETEHHNGNLSLHRLWFFIQNNLNNLSIMSNIVAAIFKSDIRGGRLLTLLHDYISGSIGNSKAQELFVHLLQAASVPYMKMLGMWIYKGVISDPISEFMIEDNQSHSKDDMPKEYSSDYWKKCYTLRTDGTPKFLESSKDDILNAGKYLNVIRQCGKLINTKVEKIEYNIEPKHYKEAIDNAFQYSSKTLLDLMKIDHDLIGRLRSVKHYFLLDQGDFIVTFLTLCEKELGKDVADVIYVRLESLLDLALRLSSANNDKYKDDLKVELLPSNLECQLLKILTVIESEHRDAVLAKAAQSTLTVIKALAFSYHVEWPVSLVLEMRSLTCYQMLFRHLFYCKYVERLLCQVWRSNKVAKAFPYSAAGQYRTAFALRQRMLHCIQNLEYHMMFEVIEPHWCTFMQKMYKVKDVDEILKFHKDFLDTCLKDCMLTMPVLLKPIINILEICIKFCKFMQGETLQMGVTQPSEQHQSFKESINFLDRLFSAGLKELLDNINGLNKDTSNHERLYNLLYRLDFNCFYTGQFERFGFNDMEANTSG